LFPEGAKGMPADFLIVIVPVPAIITLVVVVSVIAVGVAVMIVGLPLIVITVGIITVGIGWPYGNHNLRFGFRRNQSEKSRGDQEH
jgi:predicted RND superfamily exporter protein